MHGHALILSHKTVYLFAIVSNRRQDRSQGLEAHGYIQEVSCEEEVVVVSQDGHGHVPGQIQEGLQTQWSGRNQSCMFRSTEKVENTTARQRFN